jgi:hypothetical protein
MCATENLTATSCFSLCSAALAKQNRISANTMIQSEVRCNLEVHSGALVQRKRDDMHGRGVHSVEIRGPSVSQCTEHRWIETFYWPCLYRQDQRCTLYMDLVSEKLLERRKCRVMHFDPRLRVLL